MQKIRKVITPHTDNITIQLPSELVNHKLEIIILPYSEHRDVADKQARLLKIYQESRGMLPKNYKLNREEIHAR